MDNKIKRRNNIRETIRFVQIDKKLRGGKFVKMKDLIFEFGVNQRTIERDFAYLRDEMDAPLEYDRTRKAYHYTDPTFSIPNVVLTEGELFTVSILTHLMEQYKNTPLERSFKNIMQKVASFLPENVVVNSAFLNSDICFISDPLPKIDEHCFNAIFTAIRSRTVISFDYKSSKRKTYNEKIFDAYNVLCQKGNWYTIGLDHGTNEIRVYALARIKNIAFKPESFTIPNDFNIENHIDMNFGIWNNPKQVEEYEILFSPQTSNYILEREWHKEQQTEIYDDGSVLLKFKSNQKQMILSWIMGFGNEAIVINPPELREKIKAECEAMIRKYKSDKD
ncbi:MAG: WYL domain-containing protein [Treponemataceae bacterium]|nr:WYL domain-containing protein [Treponemataceae bacterium]